MAASHNIKYLLQDQIDKTKWDRCIDESPNGLIYAYSFYLDQMSTHWDALVLDEYKAVMPLPWRKKAGIYYLYQPFNIAQLGIFGEAINQELVAAFLNKVPRL